MRISSLIVAFTFASLLSAAQDIDSLTTGLGESDSMLTEGKVEYVFHDQRIPRLDSLAKLSPPKLEGYRLQIFFGEKRKAEEIRAEFKREHPEMGAYISYLAPNFRLRVGDFRSKLACEKFKAMVRDSYPSSYIVRDEIELPPLQREKEKLSDSN